MNYTYKIIQGEKALTDLIHRMKGPTAKVTWIETIGHLDEITVELIYLSSPKYDGYRAWYLLYMKHQKGTFTQLDDLRKEAFAKVRNGEL